MQKLFRAAPAADGGRGQCAAAAASSKGQEAGSTGQEGTAGIPYPPLTSNYDYFVSHVPFNKIVRKTLSRLWYQVRVWDSGDRDCRCCTFTLFTTVFTLHSSLTQDLLVGASAPNQSVDAKESIGREPPDAITLAHHPAIHTWMNVDPDFLPDGSYSDKAFEQVRSVDEISGGVSLVLPMGPSEEYYSKCYCVHTLIRPFFRRAPLNMRPRLLWGRRCSVRCGEVWAFSRTEVKA